MKSLRCFSSFYLSLLVLILICIQVTSRHSPDHALLSDNTSGEVSNQSHKEEHESSDWIVRLFGTEEEKCEQMYGFLPCSKSVSGHVFLIFVYEYLLFHAESYVASGGQRIFKILGPGVFGACAFQIIGCLPEALILLASGLLNSKEVAQECVLTGVGLLAGSSILLLTLVWGTCVLLGSQQFSNYLQSDSSSCSQSQNPLEQFLLSLWPGYGVVTDAWAGYTARIMLVSVIPFVIIQFPRLFHLSSSLEPIFVVIALFVAVVFLISYFFYQLFQPWIQRRQLLYIKHGHLVVDILKHVEKHTMGKLYNDDGTPNLSVIRRIFEETDQDEDKTLTQSELREFLRDIEFRKLHSDKDKATEDMMKDFDMDNDNRINIDEFVKGMEKWIDQTKKDSGKENSIHEVIQPWIQKKREEREMMKSLIPDVLQHLQSSVHGHLLNGDGTPDIPVIKRLFKDIDHDKDESISYSELKDIMINLKSGAVLNDTDNAASKIMEELDISGDKLINEDEFVTGLTKWLTTSYSNQSLISDEPSNSDYHKKWEQTDKLVEDKFIERSVFAWMKALSLMLLGIVMLGLLAEPLIHSVQDLSRAANIPSFFIAFIFVPFASNARIAVSAINEARRKKLNVNSLTFSELYGTVLMNNLLGFSVLLSLIYFRGLSWNFSVEVLMVLVASAIMGCLASFSTIFPVWTSLLAYLLYPLSLILVIVYGDFNWLLSYNREHYAKNQ